MANMFDQRRLQIEAMMNRMASNPHIPPQAMGAVQDMHGRLANRARAELNNRSMNDMARPMGRRIGMRRQGGV